LVGGGGGGECERQRACRAKTRDRSANCHECKLLPRRWLLAAKCWLSASAQAREPSRGCRRTGFLAWVGAVEVAHHLVDPMALGAESAHEPDHRGRRQNGQDDPCKPAH